MKDIFTIVKPIPEFEKLHALGLDFSGIVSRVGPGVENLKVGDRVFGSNYDGQLPSYVVTSKHVVMPIPSHMSAWEASTLPLIFSTAFYSLVMIAKLKPEDTVLIHTGAGGVGMSAIQIAKEIGAKIITTAGSERKRAYLKRIGIEHVFHSRNTRYEQEIMKMTNGKGVNVVLNSLTGPSFKEATLRSCAPNARWVEISKITIWTVGEVKSLRPDVDYTIFDVTDLIGNVWHEMNQEMEKFIKTGSIQHVPFEKFDALHFRQALYYFQKAKHIGKLICVMPEVVLRNGQYQVTIPLFNDDSTYLITGGLGGIGFEVCKWMLERGAIHIVLVGRSPPRPEIADQIKALNDKAANTVMVIQGDVGDYNQCKEIIAEIAKRNPNKPLRGVMHSAGVIRDNLYSNQTWESFNETYKSKVSGTWNLHGLTSHLPLEHFVMYSSLTALIGTPGQPNYSAANGFEDAFAKYRWGMGLPATTVNWGQWAQVGLAKELTLTGVLPVSVKRMLSGLEILMRKPRVQACFSEFDSFSNLSLMCPQLKSYLDPRLWKQVKESRDGIQGINGDEFWREMDECGGREEKIRVFSEYLKKILRGALRLEPTDPINDDQNIRDLGADSLMMMELKNSIQSLFGGRLQITASLFKDCNTVRELSTAVVNKLEENEQGEMEPLLPAELLELLEQDCKLEEDINAGGETNVKRSSQVKTVLVTGATGHLGPHILAKLCNDQVFPGIKKIVCLIRGGPGGSGGPEEKLKKVLETFKLDDKVDLDRVTCVWGNVALKGFGLPEKVYADLCQDVDGIIHCAVKTHHLETYRPTEKGFDIRSVNVVGTKNILRFAVEGNTKHVYYASIFSSILGGEMGENEEESQTMSDKWPTKGDLKLMVENEMPGYPISKVVSELLMRHASEERQIPCKVFRFPLISGSSEEGRLDYSNNHYILKFLSYLKLKMIPDLVAPANVLPVDICAELSLKLFFMDAAPFDVFNVCHPCPEVEQEFLRVAKDEFGTELEVVNIHRFSEALQNTDIALLGSLKDLSKILETSDTREPASAVATAYLAQPEIFFKNEKVEALLPNYADGINSSMEIVKRDLCFLRAEGVFKLFNL